MTIIALNVAAFLYQLTLSPQAEQSFIYQHALVPPAISFRHGLGKWA
jgi:hypothetical protein